MNVWTSTMNLPSTGNSGNRNRKWPRLAILATTAAILLSAISFIEVGGAIPQPQQAFAQVEDEEDEEPMNATNAANATTTSPTDGGGAGGEEDDENDDN
jgi:hypothetical protein